MTMMPPDEPNDEEKLEQLPEDGQTPFSPADPTRQDPAVSDEDSVDQETNQSAATTYPSTDTGMDDEEIYQEGISLDEPNKGNAVVDYDKDKDQREQ
jgi:hypothetical protein